MAMGGGSLVFLKVHFNLGIKKATGEFEVQQAPWASPFKACRLLRFSCLAL